MRRLVVALVTVALATAVLTPVAAARVHITLRYVAFFDLKSVMVNRDESKVSFRALLYVRRGIAGSVRFSLHAGRRDSLVFGARLRFREGTVFARTVIDDRTRDLRLRITGGTRRFRGARGKLRFVAAGGRGDRIGLVLRLR